MHGETVVNLMDKYNKKKTMLGSLHIHKADGEQVSKYSIKKRSS